MTATPNPKIERAPICPCHDWPMLERFGRLGWVCLWCGRTIEWDGRPGRWRPEMPSDQHVHAMILGSKRPRATRIAGAMATPTEEVTA
jgi:hypothetical protein